VIPIEKEIENTQATLPYEQVSTIIENGQSFAVNECICKKEKDLTEKPCDKPLEVCMGIAPVPGIFERGHPWVGRAKIMNFLETIWQYFLGFQILNISSKH